jgi:hypothetical protein
MDVADFDSVKISPTLPGSIHLKKLVFSLILEIEWLSCERKSVMVREETFLMERRGKRSESADE